MRKGEIDTGSLDLILTHYKSPFSLGKPFFDMLALQRNVDFSKVGVVLINDGADSALDDDLFKDYPFRVDNITIPHGGVSRARNAGIDASKADWVMVCDFDDQISTTLGLQLLFSAIEEDDKDMYWSHFLEEVPTEDGAMKLLPHDRDVIFIHGKLFRRQWLVDNNIRFCDGLTLHEDVFFNTIAQAVADEDRIGEIKTGFYLWCHNPQSVGRSYKAFVFETYDHLMKQRNEIVKEYRRRKMEPNAKLAVCKTVVDAFYDFQTTYWLGKEQKAQYEKNERWFCTFLKRYGRDYAESDVKMIAKLAEGSRDFHVKTGAFMMEVNTLGKWLQHIMDDVEPYAGMVLDVT